MASPESAPQHRLDSWKEIARYLRREVRTIQRWEANEGLPIHRHLHDTQVTVYAFPAELDDWLAKRRPSEESRGPVVAECRVRWWRLHRTALLSSGAALALLVIGVWVGERTVAVRRELQPREWILLADFENRTGEHLFDGTLQYALERVLSNSPFVSIVPHERTMDTLRLMRRPPDIKIDTAIGREICMRDGGIRVLLTGAVEKLGSTYVFSARLVEPIQGRTLAAAAEQATGPEQVWPAVRELSNWVRHTLGEQLNAIQPTGKQLQRVTTPSLRALQVYSQAEAAGHENKWGASEQLVRQALQYDPEFASGWIWLAWSLRHQGKPLREYKPLAQKALSLSEKASEREHFFILGSYHQFAGQDEEAVEAYSALAQLYPDDIGARNNLIYVCSREELPSLMMGYADLRPNDFRMNEEAAGAAAGSGDFVNARRYWDRARALLTPETGKLFPGEETEFELFPVHEAWLRDDPKSGIEELSRLGERLDSLDPVRREIFTQHAGLCYLGFGKVKTAEAWFKKLADESTAHDLLALAAYVRGDEISCRDHAARFFAHPGSGRKVGYSSGVALARVGPVPQPEKFIEHYANLLENVFLVHIKGELALSQGQLGEAIQRLQQATEGFRRGGNHSFLISSDGLALAFERRGEPSQAIRVLETASQERLLELAWDAPYGVFWLRIQAHMAQLYRQVGRRDDARKIEDQLRRILAYADADHPIRVQLEQSGRE
jgi:tetratricopeptide (TPR) repeat protein